MSKKPKKKYSAPKSLYQYYQENDINPVFANFANITHSAEEYIIDFLFINPAPPPGFGKVVSRVVMTPGHAKRILMALSDNVRNYEDKFGEIKTSSVPEHIKGKVQ